MGKVRRGPCSARSRGGHNVGENVDAGLPNITGQMPYPINYSYNTDYPKTNNALYRSGKDEATHEYGNGTDGDTLYFDASKSNPIYGASDTVQMAAHFVIYWKRIE